MLITQVQIEVKPEFIEAFKAACLENAAGSLREPGIVRFDLLQQQDNPARFILVEIFRNAEAPALHKQTAHYKKWAESVAGMMAAPRHSIKFTNIFPADADWEQRLPRHEV